MTIRHRLGLLSLAVALLTSCQPAEPASGKLALSQAWARATAAGQDTGGVFLIIRNNGRQPDRLVGGSTPAARAVEIHAMHMDGDVMRMRRQDGMAIAPGSAAELQPGGTHLMLVGLKAPLAAGSSFPLTLDFAASGHKQVEVAVRPIGATGPRAAGDE
jgi:copper(I)-binding protein